MLCHLSPIINRVPTPREISAANGININDLYLRFMMRPIGVFANKEDAKAFAVEASKSLDGTITMLAFYEPNVQPPYTTAEVIHRDKEVAKFMSTFKKHEQAERKEFEDHVVEIYKEIQTLSARSQSETKKLQAEQAALGGNEAIKPPPKLNELVDTGMIFAENPELEKKKLDDLEAAIDEDKDWLERCLVCDDPKGELAKIISASQGFIEGFEWREMAVKKHLALLREKVKIARAQFQICVDEETETEEDVEDTSSMKDKLEQIASHLAAAPSAPSASSKTRVKRFIESPDKTQLYAVTMDDKALLIKPSERDLYEAVETTAPETSSCDDVINEDVWYDCENPRPKRLTREQRMAAAGLCEEMLNNGSDEIDGGINDTRAVLSAYNERMRKQREHEQELIAQGIDPRTVYPLPKDPSLD